MTATVSPPQMTPVAAQVPGEASADQNPTTSFADALQSANAGVAAAGAAKQQDANGSRRSGTEEKEHRTDRAESKQPTGNPSTAVTPQIAQAQPDFSLAGCVAIVPVLGPASFNEPIHGEGGGTAVPTGDNLPVMRTPNSGNRAAGVPSLVAPVIPNPLVGGTNGALSDPLQKLSVPQFAGVQPHSTDAKNALPEAAQVVAPGRVASSMAVESHSNQGPAAANQPQEPSNMAAVVQQIATSAAVDVSTLIDSRGQAPVELPPVNGLKQPSGRMIDAAADSAAAQTGASDANPVAKPTAGIQNAPSKDVASGNDRSQHGDQGQASTGDQAQAARSGAAASIPAIQSSAANSHLAPAPPHIPATGDSRSALAAEANSKQSAQGMPANVPDVTPAHAAINTVRLIQSMHDSEMRVGMRSVDFGNISISASTNRDSISAQISLEHAELAKEITAGLPEIRAALGDSHLEVRLVAAGQPAGHFDAGTSNSGNQSRQERPQTVLSHDAVVASGVGHERILRVEPAIIPVLTGSSRLDVRI